MKKIIPKFLKYFLIFIYIVWRCLSRGKIGADIKLNLAGVLPSTESKIIIHGGKVKLLPLREKFGDTWKKFNIAYFVSSGLPFAPKLWLKIYKFFDIKTVWNQNGLAYPAWAGGKTEAINRLMSAIHLSDYVIYQTKFTKKCSDKFLGTYNGPSEILINPVDTKLFSPRQEPLPTEPFVVLMSGHHFESEERLTISIDAIRKLRERGIYVRLTVIGNTQKLPTESWIEVVGKFSQKEAPDLYHKAHILLHLKNLDPCPTFVLEALASGLPVVGLGNGGMPELVDENSGILIPCEENFSEFRYPNAETVAKVINSIRLDLERFRLGARAQSLKFDKKNWLKRHKEIFDNLCQKSQ